MLRTLILGIGLFLLGTPNSFAQLQRITCQTQGPPIYLDQNIRNEYESAMDQNGCIYSYTTLVFIEKRVIMKPPDHDDLSQTGESGFFYKPKAGFKGRDNFTIYLCGSRERRGSGCARLNYNVTVQ